jgi:hypothetical protein
MPADAASIRSVPVILGAGIVAGTLDITAAFATWAPKGVSPVRILQSIASGLLGAASFRAGWKSAALGGAFQYLIATTAAAVYFAAARKLPILTRRPVVFGALYGIGVYLVMYRIVMPLSRVHRSPFSWSATAIAVVTHIVCVGIPIGLVLRRGTVPLSVRTIPRPA